MGLLFQTKDCKVRTHVAADAQAILAVYEQSEDFLSLGPVAKASMAMVSADIEHAANSAGVYCVIEDSDGSLIGVLDFVPEYTEHAAFLSLLMISSDRRNRGYGRAIMTGLESYLRQHYETRHILSGVQTNNDHGIRFWKKCGFDIGHVARALDDGTVAYDMKKDMRQTP